MNAGVSELAVPVAPADHIQGYADAPVTLVEYGDYQCPACVDAYPEIKRIQHDFGPDLRFVFRNFPLSRLHPLAQAAAEMAEAASLQHRFWAAHDWLYEHQPEWATIGPKGLDAGLCAIGLSSALLARSTHKLSADQRIHADVLTGMRSDVSVTPCFFLNGYRYDGNAISLERIIDELIERA